MSRYIVIFSIVLVVSIGSVQRATSQEDIERTLTRAQNLYYEARFKDSVDLLLPVDAALRQRPAPGGLTIGVKLQLALSYIGQNLTREAKAAFQEVCVLDPEYSLDSSQFSPKVIALFNDAKAEQEKIKCEARCGQIDKLSKSGDVAGLLTLAEEASPGCSCVASAGAADVLFKQGLDAYRKDDFAGALEKFRGALKFRPDLDVAIQYAELADAKMTIATEQMLLDWRKHFAAHEFPQAASVYRRLESSNIEGARPGLEQIRAEYRKAVQLKVESWNQSCSTRTPAALDTLRQETRELLPDPSLAGDLVSRLVPCTPEPTAVASTTGPVTLVSATSIPPTVVPPTQGCLEMTSVQAMPRLKSRVNPDIPPNLVPLGSLDIVVKVRIDEDGNVAVNSVETANLYIKAAMREAVEKWKFLPAIAQDQRRCVDTDLSIRLSRY